MHQHKVRQRRGASLLEIIVVGLIVLVLLALSIPLVQNMRELTRRRNCDQNLIRLALACQAYVSSHEHFPAGTASYDANFLRIGEASNLGGFDVELMSPPNAAEGTGNPDRTGPGAAISKGSPGPIRSLPEGYHHNWISAILPRLDRQGLYESIYFEVSVYDPANRLPREADLAPLRCPTLDDLASNNTSSYAGSSDSRAVAIDVDNDGMLFLNAWVMPDAIADGQAYTLLLGEKLSPPPDDLSWMSGTRSTIRNSGHGINQTFFGLDDESFDPTELSPLFVGGWGSLHAGGANLVMVDGSVEFVSDSIDEELLREKATRAESESRDKPAETNLPSVNDLTPSTD